MLRAVIFDLDGTLVDSAPDTAAGINRMLAEHDLPPLGVRAVEQFIGEEATALVAKVYAHIGERVDEGRIAADTARYLEHYREQPAAGSTLYADAATALPALRAAGLRLGVCTNKPQSLPETVLAHFGLAASISVVVGSDTTPQRKPHSAPLRHALAGLGVAAHEAVFVGNTGIDRETAAAGDVACRIAEWGTGPAVEVPAAARLRCFADLLPAAPRQG